jgi:molybdopterin synthase catalytic subunit
VRELRFDVVPVEPIAAPAQGDEWLAVTDAALPIAAIYDWSVRPGCGAVVLFSGTIRDHAVDDDGMLRGGVSELRYEAYTERIVPGFAVIAAEMRRRWPDIGRIAVLHRTGTIALGDSSVVIAVSAAHRPEAFDAARYGIDAVKASSPIWKHESWDGGEAWGTGSHVPVDPREVPSR